jgi:hypothetical protein
MPKLFLQLRRLLYIILFTMAWTLLVPGFISYQENLLYVGQMTDRIPKHATIAIAAFQKYKQQKSQLKKGVTIVDSLIYQNLDKKDNANYLDNLFTIKKDYQSELSLLKEPIAFRPFYGNRIPYYWFINYFALLILVFIVSPVNNKIISIRRAILVALILHLLYSSFNYLRNFLFYNEGRVIFSYAHHDISPIGFFLQEIQFFGMCLMVATIWIQWDLHLNNISKYTSGWKAGKDISLQSLNESSRFIYALFMRWQLSSILLAGGFLIWTFHFWNLAFEVGDVRYYISAIIMHLFWLVSWIILSRPLVMAFTRWTSLKSNFEAMICEKPNEFKNAEYALKYVNHLNPLSAYQLLATSVAAIGSLLLPFIDLVRR